MGILSNASNESTYSGASASSGGLMGGDRIQASLVFEKL